MAATDDPLVKVTVFMPASLAQRLREHATLLRSSVSKLCRAGALRELDRAAAAPSAIAEDAP